MAVAAFVAVVFEMVIEPVLATKLSVKYKSNVVGLVEATQAPFKGDNGGVPEVNLPECMTGVPVLRQAVVSSVVSANEMAAAMYVSDPPRPAVLKQLLGNVT
jgi:hypothetical protein